MQRPITQRSVWGPGAAGERTVWVKAGTGFCEGTVTGDFPECDGPLPVDDTTWGRIKNGF